MSKKAQIRFQETIANIHNKYEKEIQYIDNLIDEASSELDFIIKIDETQIDHLTQKAKHLKMYYLSLGFNVYYFAKVYSNDIPYITISWKPKEYEPK